MVSTIKFSEFVNGADLANADLTVGLRSGLNTRFNNPWTFYPPGNTAARPLTPIVGKLRFNTDLDLYEFWTGSLWTQLITSETGNINPGLMNDLAYYAADGTTLSPLATTANGALVTDNTGAPFIGLTLPLPVQDNITQLGHLTTLDVGNLELTVNTISSVDPDGNINLTPNGVGQVLVPVTPLMGESAASKAYVDAHASGFVVLPAARVGSTGPYTVTYDNGAAGVGATLTNAGAQVVFSADGISPNVSDRVLIKNQTDQSQNGIYVVSDVGSGATNWILTRAGDYDEASEIIPGTLVIITEGNTLAQSSWIQTQTVTTVGTDPIIFVQFTASIPVNVPSGGTGKTTLTAYELIAGGTTSTSPMQQVPFNTLGYILQSEGAGVLPSFTKTLSVGLTMPSITFSSTAEIIGTTTNNNANAGSVGQVISNSVSGGAAVFLAGSAVATNITVITITAGDWDVFGSVVITGTATAMAGCGGAINTISATFPSADQVGAGAGNDAATGAPATVGDRIITPSIARISVAAPTFVYLIGEAIFSGGTGRAYGKLVARRRR